MLRGCRASLPIPGETGERGGCGAVTAAAAATTAAAAAAADLLTLWRSSTPIHTTAGSSSSSSSSRHMGSVSSTGEGAGGRAEPFVPVPAAAAPHTRCSGAVVHACDPRACIGARGPAPYNPVVSRRQRLLPACRRRGPPLHPPRRRPSCPYSPVAAPAPPSPLPMRPVCTCPRSCGTQAVLARGRSRSARGPAPRAPAAPTPAAPAPAPAPFVPGAPAPVTRSAGGAGTVQTHTDPHGDGRAAVAPKRAAAGQHLAGSRRLRCRPSCLGRQCAQDALESVGSRATSQEARETTIRSALAGC